MRGFIGHCGVSYVFLNRPRIHRDMCHILLNINSKQKRPTGSKESGDTRWTTEHNDSMLPPSDPYQGAIKQLTNKTTRQNMFIPPAVFSLAENQTRLDSSAKMTDWGSAPPPQ